MSSPWVSDSNAALLTDLYELTMLQSYFDEAMNGLSVFDLYIRRLPPNRNYLVACGLEHVLHYLETFAFSPQAIQYLSSLDRFSQSFLASLHDFRFTGDVYAVPEGTVVFAHEPILEVVAPLPQAQIVETFLMNQIQVATTAASKASRVVQAARGRSVVDFGLRRMQGADVGLKAPRAFYVAGVNATSSVVAGQIYGIPVAGTMGHSYVQSFENEIDAFRSFLRSFPTAILLIDTYDTLRAARRIVELAREMGPDFRVSGVRLDSGDLTWFAREVRKLFDAAGLTDLKIFASSSLDEYEIERLIASGAPIDGFGVGAHMAISSDAPVMDTVYKLAEYAGRPKMKLSESKSTLPGRKQIFRERVNGGAKRDVLALAGENLHGEPLLAKVMENGRRIHPLETIDSARARCRAELRSFSEQLLSLSTTAAPYPVELSPRLAQLRDEIAKSR
jgi:nicotinate phosphoribosyltransferase